VSHHHCWQQVPGACRVEDKQGEDNATATTVSSLLMKMGSTSVELHLHKTTHACTRVAVTRPLHATNNCPIVRPYRKPLPS
jgi:hypothetical protein